LQTVRLGDWDTEGGEQSDQRTIVDDITATIGALRSRSVCLDTLMDYAKGYSLAEIASARGLPLGTVKRRIHDGRELLAKALS